MTPENKLLLKRALATLVSAVCGVVITNLADPAAPVFSGHWWAHVGLGSGVLVLTFEAKFWKTWADAVLGNGNGGKT